jgi:excinuclease ABC subunit C
MVIARLSGPTAGMPAAVRQMPHSPGVYRFVDARGRTLYVGRAVDLRRRVASYWGDLGDRRHLRAMVSAINRVQAVVCASEHEAAWLERNLLETHKPPANRSRGGAEVPALFALNCGGPGAGLRLELAHSPRSGDWRHFGPYLGGDRARLALSGLHRAYSLSYCREDLTASELDLARARAARLLGRAELLQAVSAFLQHDPAATADVKSKLVGHRDRAAAALAFELAQRVQHEINAIDWLVSPQRVTSIEPYDLDFYGWDHGPLVHFSIRNGRLSTWREKNVDVQRAQRLIRTTPGEWADFAQQNAALAATLSRAQ